MPTPVHVFVDIADQYGFGSSEDEVSHFYSVELQQMPFSDRQAILDELFARETDYSEPKKRASLRTWDINYWWKRFKMFPFGKQLFSRTLGTVVPYTGSIKADIEVIRDGSAIVKLKKRRSVCNHIGSIHVAALTNLIELTGSLALLSRESEDFECMLKHIELTLVRRAEGDVIAACKTKHLTLEKFTKADVNVWCNNALVATGKCTWRIE